MHGQNNGAVVARKRPGREVIGNRPVTRIMASLCEQYAREYLAGTETRPLDEFLAARLKVTRASADRVIAVSLVSARVSYTALKVSLMGAFDAADRAGRDVLEEVA